MGSCVAVPIIVLEFTGGVIIFQLIDLKKQIHLRLDLHSV